MAVMSLMFQMGNWGWIWIQSLGSGSRFIILSNTLGSLNKWQRIWFGWSPGFIEESPQKIRPERMGMGRFKCQVKKFGCDLIGNEEIPRISDKYALRIMTGFLRERKRNINFRALGWEPAQWWKWAGRGRCETLEKTDQVVWQVMGVDSVMETEMMPSPGDCVWILN